MTTLRFCIALGGQVLGSAVEEGRASFVRRPSVRRRHQPSLGGVPNQRNAWAGALAQWRASPAAQRSAAWVPEFFSIAASASAALDRANLRCRFPKSAGALAGGA